MFNRRAIHNQPDFQMRRGGTYKTYESPLKPFRWTADHAFNGKKIIPTRQSLSPSVFHVKYQLNNIMSRPHWLVPTGLSAPSSGCRSHFE